jgi:hypothetical protein
MPHEGNVKREYNPPTKHFGDAWFWFSTEIFWLPMDTAQRYQEGLNENGSGSSITVRALTRWAVHNEPSNAVNTWIKWQ